MRTGMLWFDGGCEPLEERVRKAAVYYERKYGQRPTLCLAHPGDAAGTPAVRLAGGEELAVRGAQFVMAKHLLLGVEEAPDA